VRRANDTFSGLQHLKDIYFILPDAIDDIRKEGNMIRIPYDAPFFHPDLIQASDAVVGKAGYSTIAEVYHAGKPFGYVSRPSFRESPVLERFITKHMTGKSIEEAALYDGRWQDHIEELLSMSSKKPEHPNGADQIAAFILNHIDS
jgi:UDP-N-acetylglucosamine:LPS N-acetylglucosamine transferase